MVKWGKCPKIRVKMLKNTFLADHPVLITLILFTPESIQKIITCFRFPKIPIFSTRADISGVSFIYKLDTFLGHPVGDKSFQKDFNLKHIVSHGVSEPCWAQIQRPVIWKLPGTGMSNMNLFTTGTIQGASDIKITFSQGDSTKYLN